jgi:hypothetical protein
MNKYMYVGLSVAALALLGFMGSACVGPCAKKSGEEELESALEDLEEDMEKAVEESEGGGEAEESEGGGGGGDICDQYEACCKAYADALSQVEGVPESSIDAQKKACDNISEMKKAPGSDEACKQALDAMKQASEAYKQMPGFEWPEECE